MRRKYRITTYRSGYDGQQLFCPEYSYLGLMWDSVYFTKTYGGGVPDSYTCLAENEEEAIEACKQDVKEQESKTSYPKYLGKL